MNSDNSELQNIKDRIILSSEIEKKTPIITKGNDKWCLCLFHKEKTEGTISYLIMPSVY